MQISFIRGEVIEILHQQLPADFYKRLHLLLVREHADSLFIPIRSMTYQAAIDKEEIIFVDGLRPHIVELAWSNFRPGLRNDLRQPVAYDCLLYENKAREILPRLQGEFFQALLQYQQKLSKTHDVSTVSATVTPFKRKD